jgi:hypothetical protein
VTSFTRIPNLPRVWSIPAKLAGHPQPMGVGVAILNVGIEQLRFHPLAPKRTAKQQSARDNPVYHVLQ